MRAGWLERKLQGLDSASPDMARAVVTG